MFPNPQDAIPLPPRPDLEQYRTLAKDLIKACRSGDPDAIGAWADRWMESLVRALGMSDNPRERRWMERTANDVEIFANKQLRPGAEDGCVLAEAQFVIARSHGYLTWATLVETVEALGRDGNDVADYEAAADAIVEGDVATLKGLLASNPRLVHARSTREHRATLLHYTSANGVEGYRQRTPKNIVKIAEMLLAAGADVNAEADVYGGGATTILLVATSVHPAGAGVQIELMELLAQAGADLGEDSVRSCLANGQPEAAAWFAERGAPMNFEAAAATGRLDLVRQRFLPNGDPKPGITQEDVQVAFQYACGYGETETAENLLDHGADVGGSTGGDGQTGMHYAVIGGHLDTVRMLLKRKAPLEAYNMYGGNVLGQTLWSAAHGGDPDTYVELIEMLFAAGAKLGPRHPPVTERIDALLLKHGSVVDESRYWTGEKPRRRKT